MPIRTTGIRFGFSSMKTRRIYETRLSVVDFLFQIHTGRISLVKVRNLAKNTLLYVNYFIFSKGYYN